MLMKNENFLFNRTFYEDFWDWYWAPTMPPADNPCPQEVLSTDDVAIPGGLKATDNYLGNPYTCALDVNDLFNYWSSSNIEKKIWLWSGQAESWLTITEDMSTIDTDSQQKVIPSQQMFVVEGLSSDPSFVIPKSARTHNAHRFLKGDAPLRNELLIEVRDPETDSYSRMAIGLRSWGKLSGDDSSDAKYLKNENTGVPQIYAVVPHKDSSVPFDTLTINSLPEDVHFTDFNFVPAQMEGNRKYIMRISRQQSLTTPLAVLTDKKTENEINLFENSVYEFFAGKNDDNQRFSIRFVPQDVNRIADAEIVPRDAYTHKQVLYITNNLESDAGTPVEIYSASGLLVYRNEITQVGVNSYPLSLTTGVYIVKSGEIVRKIKILK
jgi:hypothetical protein